MQHKILYLTPYSPMLNGIADYAVAYKNAIETYTDWSLEVYEPGNQLTGSTLSDLRTIRQRVTRWRDERALSGIALIHAEVGYRQQDTFYTLYWLRKLLPRVPFCVTVHDPPLVIAPVLKPLSLGTDATPVKRLLRMLDYTPLSKRIIRSVLGHAAQLLVLSDPGTRALRRVLPSHPYLRSLPFLTYRRDRPALRKRHTGPVTILFAGFWAPSKGIGVLLKAVERISAGASSNSPAVRLLLGGGAEQSRAGQRYLSETLRSIKSSPAHAAVEVPGYIPAAELDAAFDAADIFVLPATGATGYSSSSVLFRAMTAGLPIVATTVGAVGEEIRHEETGLLVNPGDADSLAEALERLVNDPLLRQCLGTQAQDHIYAEHSQEHVARIVGGIYDRIAATK